MIKDVVFKACDFTESFKDIIQGDFVYIHFPPRLGETSTPEASPRGASAAALS